MADSLWDAWVLHKIIVQLKSQKQDNRSPRKKKRKPDNQRTLSSRRNTSLRSKSHSLEELERNILSPVSPAPHSSPHGSLVQFNVHKTRYSHSPRWNLVKREDRFCCTPLHFHKRLSVYMRRQETRLPIPALTPGETCSYTCWRTDKRGATHQTIQCISNDHVVVRTQQLRELTWNLCHVWDKI